MAQQSRWDSSHGNRHHHDMSNNKRGHGETFNDDDDFRRRGGGGGPASYNNTPSNKRRDTKNRGYNTTKPRRDEKYCSHDNHRGGNSKDGDYYGRGGGGGRGGGYAGEDDYYYDNRQRRGGGGGGDDYHNRDRGGGNDTRHSGRYSSASSSHGDDWRCKECRTWNYPGEDLCRRCGTDNQDHDITKNRDRSNKFRGSSGYEEDEKPPKEQNEWPPCFEKNGSSYVFDARSGFFYDAASDFFFDPKTKLYYSNKKRSYYRYCLDENPPFQEIVSTDDTQSSGGDNEAILSQVNKSDGNNKAEEKKTISICLKTKSLGGGGGGGEKSKKTTHQKEQDTTKDKKNSPNPTSTTNTATTSVKKEHAANLEKWAERGKEIRGGEKTRPTPSASSEPSDKSLEDSSEKVERTITGQPFCRLCRRKFQSVEKLRKHEKLSALHKENLAKKEAADEKKKLEGEPTAPSLEYRDRAKERRFMYGPETGSTGMMTQSGGGHDDDDVAKSNMPRPTEFVRPEENLGESNIGNQMLQKLGWKTGHALGRKQQGGNETKEGDGTSSTDGRGNDLHDTIRKDWQKIESMAGGGQQSSRTGGSGGIGSG